MSSNEQKIWTFKEENEAIHHKWLQSFNSKCNRKWLLKKMQAFVAMMICAYLLFITMLKYIRSFEFFLCFFYLYSSYMIKNGAKSRKIYSAMNCKIQYAFHRFSDKRNFYFFEIFKENIVLRSHNSTIFYRSRFKRHLLFFDLSNAIFWFKIQK